MMRVNTTLCNVVFFRKIQCDNLNRQVLPLNFEHVQKSEATILWHKTNAMHRATEATGRTNCEIYDRKLF